MKDIYVVMVEYWHGNTLISTKNSQTCYSTFDEAKEFVKSRNNVEQILPHLYKEKGGGTVYKIYILQLNA